MAAAPPALKMIVEKGTSVGTEVTVAPGRTLTIGRRPGADLLLSGDDFVSLDHAEIEYASSGPVLRNRSANGTLLNGRPVTETSLATGDRISIGLTHLIAVRHVPASTRTIGLPVRKTRRDPNGTAEDAPRTTTNSGLTLRFRVPWWLIAYFVVIACAGVFFGYLKLRGSTALSLPQVQTQEAQHAAARKWPDTDTERLFRLLETAAVHERRGDTRSAYEVYREALVVRQPVDPRSPAYRYSAARMAALGPK